MIRFTLTRAASNELDFKVRVTEDDHGHPGDEPCQSCRPEDLDEQGECQLRKEAAEVRAQLDAHMSARRARGKHDFSDEVRMELSLEAATYAAGEFDNAADICEGNAPHYDGADRMDYLAKGRSYRTAEERILAAIRAAA